MEVAICWCESVGDWGFEIVGFYRSFSSLKRSYQLVECRLTVCGFEGRLVDGYKDITRIVYAAANRYILLFAIYINR